MQGVQAAVFGEVGEVDGEISWNQVGHGKIFGFYSKSNHWRSFKETGA